MLSSGRKNSVVDGEFHGAEENLTWTPPLVTAAEYREIIERDIPPMEDYLRPADPKQINQRVVALLSHYFVADIPAQAQLAALADWVAVLSRFPMWAITAAATEWLSEQRRKPTPADIVAGCRWRVAEPALNLKLLRKVVQRYEREGRRGA